MTRAQWTDYVEKRVSETSRARVGGRVSVAKPGWVEIGGQRFYSRSKAERNYARYLEWLKQWGEIDFWEYEPCTFWFEGIRRGVTNYTPDFYAWEARGERHYIEVKGYLDPKSKTKLKRMAKFHPDVKVVLIGSKEMREISKKVSGLIAGWE